MASPIPATAYQGLVRPHGSQLLEVWPPYTFQNRENINQTDANSGTHFMTNQSWGESWCLPGELQAQKRHQLQLNTPNKRKSETQSMDPDPNLKPFPITFVSFGC